MDRIQAMRSFICIVNEGSFTQASERLDLSPQLVSKYVSQLEEHLGVRLLNRTTRRLHLTEAGEGYYPRAKQLLNELDDLENQLTDLQTETRGRLRISAPVSFAIRHLAPLVSAFQKQHPAVSIDLQLNDRKVDLVEEGFDLALRIGHLQSSSLIAKRLAPVRLALCASPEYLDTQGRPQEPADLNQHRYLRYSYMNLSREDSLYPWLQGRHEDRQGEVTSNNGDVLIEAALAGAGIALQPTFIAGQALQEGRLERVLPEYEPASMGLYAVYAHRNLLAGKIRQFIDFMEGYFGDPPYWDRF
ncbi:LysR family transcriptional regulator [Marinospirillum perlucidum]|uniref:LysR family transcriptional regulator n=1 Tax=Marinospirillum perlucidum TaxID=1982602 RepID=UPI000DF3A304|nr:LysR family transcriptional regulator [Marinospirillum perlucidum]